MTRLALSLLCCLPLACAPVDDDNGPGAAVDEVLADGKADSATPLRAHVDGFTVWVDATPLTRATRGGQPVWLLGGRVSKNLDGVMSFVPDDVFGAARVVSARTFEVALADSELVGLASGQALLISFTSGKTHYTARVVLQNSLAGWSGSGPTVSATLAPVYVAGAVAFRGHATTTPTRDQLLVSNGASVGATGTTAGGTHQWRFDWTRDAFAGALGQQISFTARGAGGASTKQATLRTTVTQLGLTTQDPYEIWPAPACAAKVRACLAALPAGGDTEACGAYRAVLACAPLAGDCGSTLDTALTAATDGLLFPSESDRPFELFRPTSGDLTAGNAAQLLALLGKPSDTPVVVRSIDDELAWLTRDDPSVDATEAAQIARFKALKALLHRELGDVQVYRVGTIEVGLYFVGHSSCGELVGVNTIAIET